MTYLAAGAHQSGEAAVFWILAVVSVAAALGMILVRKVVYSAMLLAAVMLSLAVLYAVNEAPFLAFVQVIVYTGAVLMLFLFVVMIIGVGSKDSLVETIKGQRAAAAVVGVGFVALLLVGFGNAALPATAGLADANGDAGNVMALARQLFTKYVFAFELTSALLITAALGAMVLTHRERLQPKPTQKDLARQRIKSDRVSPLPPPGTYARHNAVDMPARLPDGSLSELSVSPVIARRQAGDHEDLHGEAPEAAVEHGSATLRAVLDKPVEVEEDET